MSKYTQTAPKTRQNTRKQSEIILQIFWVFVYEWFFKSIALITSIPASPNTGKTLNKNKPKLDAQKYRSELVLYIDKTKAEITNNKRLVSGPQSATNKSDL